MANTISVSVLADVRDINSKLGSIDSRLGKTGSAFKKVGGLIAGAFAGGAAIRGIGAMVSSASDLNETISKTETIFGKSSPAIMNWAKGAATSLGLSQQAALDGASTFGNFFNQIGIGAKQTSSMSKAFVQASVDLGSFHNVAAPEVMDALAAATRGEYDTLQKFIPTINAARVEQEALNATGKKTAANLTDQDKALAVHALVMKGQGKAAGDFARTQGSLANQTKIAKAQFDNAVATLGQKLLPIAVKLVTTFNQHFIPGLQKIGSYIKGTVVPALQDLGRFVGQNKDLFIALGVGLGTALAAMKIYGAYVLVVTKITAAWTIVQKVLNGTMRVNPVFIVITALALLAVGLTLAYRKSETFRKIVDGAFKAIKKVTQAVFPVIKTVIVGTFKVIGTVVRTVARAIKTIVTATWNAIKVATKVAWNVIKNTVLVPIRVLLAVMKGDTAKAKTIMRDAWNAIKSVTKDAWNAIRDAVKAGIDKAVEFVKGLKGRVLGAMAGAASWLYNAGKDIIQGLINGIESMIGVVRDKLGQLTKLIPDLKGPASVDRKLLYKNGQLIIQGLLDGFDDKERDVKYRLASLTKNIGNNYGMDMNSPQFTANGVAGGSGGVVIQINMHPTSNPVDVGREVYKALNAYTQQKKGRTLAI